MDCIVAMMNIADTRLAFKIRKNQHGFQVACEMAWVQKVDRSRCFYIRSFDGVNINMDAYPAAIRHQQAMRTKYATELAGLERVACSLCAVTVQRVNMGAHLARMHKGQ
jgi:hypothetical protein